MTMMKMMRGGPMMTAAIAGGMGMICAADAVIAPVRDDGTIFTENTPVTTSLLVALYVSAMAKTRDSVTSETASGTFHDQ